LENSQFAPNGSNFFAFFLFLITRLDVSAHAGMETILFLSWNESPYFRLHKELLISLKLPLLSRQSRNYTHLKVNARVRAHLLFLCLTKNFYTFHPPTPARRCVFFSQQQSSRYFSLRICMNYTLLCVAGCGARKLRGTGREQTAATLKKIKTNIILGFHKTTRLHFRPRSSL
jgi:hypothetical protein